MKRRLKKGDEVWLMINNGFYFDPKTDRRNPEGVWNDEDLKEFCENKSHPLRFVKIKVLEDKAYWKKHEDTKRPKR